MIGLNLIAMATACGGSYVGDSELAVRQPNEIVIDSRLVQEGNLFCALPGSYLAPGLGRTEEDITVASGVCSLLTAVTLVVFCVISAFVA